MAHDLNGSELVANGQNYTQQATTAGALIGPAGARRLVAVIGISGTGAVTLYDNASAASGTILWTSAATAVGTRYLIDIPATNGIYAVVAAATTVNIIWS